MSSNFFGFFSDSDNDNRAQNLEAEFENRFGDRGDLLLSTDSDDSDSEVSIDGRYQDQIDTIHNRLRGYITRNRNGNENLLDTERRRNRIRSRIQNRTRNRNENENENANINTTPMLFKINFHTLKRLNLSLKIFAAPRKEFF
eukprot:Anaeramoba_flamelloidesc30513_g1_i1.p1 GENE.c30513_g1_i1~~c30513_g1_i1.p1  ORF type:complete len:150 (+),score=31.99 c30513_g1_i1:22-450(+)